jgi:hypothetical protein
MDLGKRQETVARFAIIYESGVQARLKVNNFSFVNLLPF